MPVAADKDRIFITLPKTTLTDIRKYAKENKTTVSLIVQYLVEGEMKDNEEKISKWIATN